MLDVSLVFPSHPPDREDDRPNHKRLYTSDLVYMKENHIVLNYRRYTAMNTEARPCDPDENYSLQRCLELHYSGRYWSDFLIAFALVCNALFRYLCDVVSCGRDVLRGQTRRTSGPSYAAP